MSTEENNEATLIGLQRLLSRHVISITLEWKPSPSDPQKKEYEDLSGFLVEIGSALVFVTAGHVLRSISKNLEMGRKIEKAVIFDAWGLNPIDQRPIPFAFSSADKIEFGGAEGDDFGMVVLRDYYRWLILANNLIPIKIADLSKAEGEFIGYKIIGIPRELQSVIVGGVTTSMVMFSLEGCDKKDVHQSLHKDAPRFYGRLPRELTLDVDSAALTQIKGMSGGPIFGFYTNAEGQLSYKLVAVQSTWVESTHEIAACPAVRFFEILEDAAIAALAERHR